jgi:phenylacetate-CoA ligase
MDVVYVEKNKPCELIVTNLNNYVFPFIRYKINDSVVLSDKICKCGFNLPIVQNIYGKSIEVIRTPSGNNLSSADFAAFFEHYQKHTHAVRQFQIIQEQEDKILIKIVPSNIFNDNIRKDIENQLYQITQQSMKVHVIPVENIEPEKSGKTKVMILKI